VPIYSVDFEFVADQIIRVAHNHTVRFRIEIDYVARPGRASGKPFALADGEELYPLVFAEKVSIDVVNLAPTKLPFPKMGTQERLIIVARHKANLLTVYFVRNF